jgi:hypothetical protein
MNYKTLENETDIFNLKLHEVAYTIESAHNDELFTTVMRVHGGFIYRSMDKRHNMLTSCFVPYDDYCKVCTGTCRGHY